MDTTHGCPDCWRAKRFLREHSLEFEEINIEETPPVLEFILRLNSGRRRVPTFELEGRTFRCTPFDPSLLRRELGVASAAENAAAAKPLSQ